MEENAFGQRLKRDRERFGLSRRQLAEQIHRTPNVVRNIEEGVAYPNIETLALLGYRLVWDFNEIMKTYFGAG